MDLARQYPSAELDGFDIDISQSPPPQWLPTNVQIQELDAFSNVMPEQLINAYDVVHVAIFATVVKNDPTPLLKNLWRMLSK